MSWTERSHLYSDSGDFHILRQGCPSNVFLNIILICTLTGFVVVMGRVWLMEDSAAWFELGKLDRFLASCRALTGNGTIYHLVTILVSVCFGLFAFTCLVGFMSFTEMCANRISTRPAFINTIRVLCLVVISFGVITNIAGMEGALWISPISRISSWYTATCHYST